LSFALWAFLSVGLAVLAGSLAAGQNDKSASGKRPPKKVSVDLGGGVVLKLVGITPGKFKMGTPDKEREAVFKINGYSPYLLEEKPHEVEITKPFYMGVYEVTQAEYEKVMNSNPSQFSAKGRQSAKVAGMDTLRFPVDSVSWENAKKFCEALSKRFKKKFDLPTEAEWEYACRAGTTTTFCYGDGLSSKQANVNGEFPFRAEKGPNLGRTTGVGQYQPNAFGLYDMHGNVEEWCKDWIDRDYYKKSPPRDPQGPKEGDMRVLRGSSWESGAVHTRSAARRWDYPDRVSAHRGFRVVVRMQ
jgi:formylglycine-generating enzyme required for sulfatase activity